MFQTLVWYMVTCLSMATTSPDCTMNVAIPSWRRTLRSSIVQRSGSAGGMTPGSASVCKGRAGSVSRDAIAVTALTAAQIYGGVGDLPVPMQVTRWEFRAFPCVDVSPSVPRKAVKAMDSACFIGPQRRSSSDSSAVMFAASVHGMTMPCHCSSPKAAMASVTSGFAVPPVNAVHVATSPAGVSSPYTPMRRSRSFPVSPAQRHVSVTTFSAACAVTGSVASALTAEARRVATAESSSPATTLHDTDTPPT